MSFFGFNKKDKQTEEEKLRARQVSQFLELNPGARALNAEKTAYEVSIPTQFGSLIVHVVMPLGFPKLAPTVRVMNPVVHAWCDAQGVVSGHSHLNYWLPHQSLGRIVREIGEEFKRNPPKPRPKQPQSQQQVPVARPPVSMVLPQQQQRQQQQQQQQRRPPVPQRLQRAAVPAPQVASANQHPPVHTPRMPVPQRFHALDSLTIAELEALDRDPHALTYMFDNFEQVKALYGLRDDLYNSIEKTATENLKQQPTVEGLQKQNTEARATVAAQQLEYNKLQAKRSQLQGNFGVANIVQLLDVRIDKEHDMSEDLLQLFKRQAEETSEDSDDSDEESSRTSSPKKKRMTLSKYCSKYSKARSKYHLLAAKKERLQRAYV